MNVTGAADTPVPQHARIRVMIVDDEGLVRAGLRAILETEPDLDVVGEAEDGSTAIELARLLRPDVVLMDIRMKRLSGLEAAREIVELGLGSRVVVLTTFDHDEHVYEALRSGISGFLLKETPADQIVAGVRHAARGDALLEPSVARRLIAEYAARAIRPSEPDQRIAALTEREREIMRLVAQGLSNVEIAGNLVIGETTVKTHVSNILAKLALRDRTQIAVTAYESGLMGSR